MTAPIGAMVELQKVTAAFQAALVKIGVATIIAALKLWRRVPANKAAETGDEWLDDAVTLVMQRRAHARALAVSYYRLTRALRTGTTIPDPYDPIPTRTTLGELRREFKRLADSVDAPPVQAPGPTTGGTPTSDTPDDSLDAQGPSEGDDTVITIDPLDGIDENGDAEEAKLERDAEEQARLVLEALGPESLKKRVEEIDHERPAREVDALREEAHAKAGSRQASASDRLAKNGARDVVHSLGERDKKVIGYVRISQTGTPCGFCAMLISRGVIFYSSKESAERATSSAPKRSEGELYHDNCNCVAEPVYSMSQYENDPMYRLNREYSDLWPTVTRGLRGKKALSAWRAYFRRTQKSGDADTGEVQAA